MSRSQPNEVTPNPALRWFEWDGGKGKIRYFDKEKKENISIELPFDFVLLDRLSTIKGWSDEAESGIYSNEVRDTRDEPFVVKAFKKLEPIAEGIYSQIKDRVKASGGKFCISCYIAFTNDDDSLALGNIQFHGSALSAWMDFESDKEHRSRLYKDGIRVISSKMGKKGGVTFQTPVFEFFALDPKTDTEAMGLDQGLQEYLKSYFKRTRIEQAEPVKSEEDRVNDELMDQRPKVEEEDVDQDVPF